MHESGQLEDDTYLAYLEWIATVLAAPGCRAWWETARSVYARRVVDALDERLSRGGLAEAREIDGYRLDDEETVQHHEA